MFNSVTLRIARALGHGSELSPGARSLVPDSATPGHLDFITSALDYGADHLSGEEPVLALSCHGWDNEEHADGLFLTNRAVVGWHSSQQQRLNPALLVALTGVHVKEQPERPRLHLHLDMLELALPVWGAQEVLELLRRVVRLPVATRAAASVPLLDLDELDPLERLDQVCLFREERIEALRAICPPSAPAARSVALMHHNLFLGRGQAEGWWLSPVSSADLLRLFDERFGDHVGMEGGVRWAIDQGVGTIQHLGLRLIEVEGIARFRLLGTRQSSPSTLQSLHLADPHYLRWLLQVLRDDEALALFEQLTTALLPEVFVQPQELRAVPLKGSLRDPHWSPAEGVPLPVEALTGTSPDEEEEALPQGLTVQEAMKSAATFQIISGVINLSLLPLIYLICAIFFLPCGCLSLLLPVIGILELVSAWQLYQGEPKSIQLAQGVAVAEMALVLCLNPLATVFGLLAMSKLREARGLALQRGLLDPT